MTVLLAALAVSAARKPNVLLIMADDLGWSDLGCYGGEIETPHLDGLAKRGLRFTQFYNTARCWPTRGALLTGYYAQQIRRDMVPGVPSGGRGARPDWAPLLPRHLKPLGYRSYHSGKWHIDGMPVEQGFDRSYYLRDQGRFFSPKVHYRDDEKLPPVERGSGFYGTTAIADHAIEVLKEHAARHAEQPFFHYLAFTAPHFPLHALPEDIAKYRERYQRDWAEVRRERYQRQRAMGLHQQALSEVERELGPPYDFPEHVAKLGAGETNRPVEWATLTGEQRRFQGDKMAVHAAMVDRMDVEIGRVLQQLRAMGELENTLIFFLSDNGASAEIMVRDDGHDPKAPPGSADTYLCLGPGWSTTCNTPFRRHKTWTHEGGCSTPLIVHWPAGLKEPGGLRHNPGHVVDIVPTILAVAGGRVPETIGGKAVPAAPGRSLLPAFDQDGAVAHESLWWFHDGHRAVRVGDYKAVSAKDEPWALYNLAEDRAESSDLSREKPDLARRLIMTWERQMNEYAALAKQDLPAGAPAGRGKAKSKGRADSKRGKAVPGTTKEAVAKPSGQVLINGETFMLKDRRAFVMMPSKENRSTPQPWIFYGPTLPRYPDQNESWMHRRFLDAGVAVAGIDVGEAYGSPLALEAFDALYEELTRRRGFAAKPLCLGRSRGGLWVGSWAIAHPERVAGLAGIYPVFDYRTYPGVKRAAGAYGMSPEELLQRSDELNPIARVPVLAKAGIPVFIIHGKDDTVVPLAQNSGALKRRYQALGAADRVTLREIEGQGHNFWPGFFQCEELVEFAIRHAKGGQR